MGSMLLEIFPVSPRREGKGERKVATEGGYVCYVSSEEGRDVSNHQWRFVKGFKTNKEIKKIKLEWDSYLFKFRIANLQNFSKRDLNLWLKYLACNISTSKGSLITIGPDCILVHRFNPRKAEPFRFVIKIIQTSEIK